MDSVFKAAWDAMEMYSQNTDGISINKKKKDSFIKDCKELYEDFKKDYMCKESDTLDKHKTAAIISIIGSSDNYIESNESINNDQFFIGQYNIPIVISLAYIEQETNKELHDFQLISAHKKVKTYVPEPTSCRTAYVDSIARILKFEEDEEIPNTLRVIELANTFFLLEECMLLKSKINMNKWVQLKRKQLSQ